MQEALGLQRGLHVLSMMYEHNYEIALHAQIPATATASAR